VSRRKATRLKRSISLKAAHDPRSTTTNQELAIAELAHELNEATERQTATTEVLKLISRSDFDLQRVLDTLTESAARLCHADMAGITRPVDQGFYYATSYNFPPDWLDFTKNIFMRAGRGSVVGRTLLDGKITHVHDVVADPEYTFRDEQRKGGYRTFLGVPLLRGDQPIGVLTLGRKQVHPFANKEIEPIAAFAAQAVIAIENARLLNELRESLQQQTATADVLKIISRSTFNLQTVFQTLIESAVKLCEADTGSITREAGSTYLQVASYGYPAELHEFMQSHPIELGRGTIIGRVVANGKPVQIADIAADPEFTFTQPIRLGNLRTMLGVPLLREGTPIGVIVLSRKTVRPFTEKQIELLATFADQAVIAIPKSGYSRPSRSAHASSVNHCSSRLRPLTCSKQLADRLSICRLCSIRWCNRQLYCAVQIDQESG